MGAAVEAVVAVDSLEVVVATEEAEEDMDNLNGVTLPMEGLVETTMEVVANLLIMWPFHQINVDLSSEKAGKQSNPSTNKQVHIVRLIEMLHQMLGIKTL